MRTHAQRRRTTVALVLLALAAATVLWVAFTMDSKGNAGLALDGSGSGSVKSGFVGSGSVGTDSAESGSTGSDSTGSDSTRSDSAKADSSDSQADRPDSTGTSTTDSGTTDSGSTGSGTTGSGSTGSGSTGSGTTGSTTGSSDTGSGDNGSSGSSSGSSGGGHTEPPAPTRGLSVRVGTLGALYPGARTTAPVTVTNLTTNELGLTDIRVGSPGTTGCGSDYLFLGHRTLGRSLTIPGHGQVSMKVRFGLRASAPDSCKGKTLPFSVNVRAVSR